MKAGDLIQLRVDRSKYGMLLTLVDEDKRKCGESRIWEVRIREENLRIHQFFEFELEPIIIEG